MIGRAGRAAGCAIPAAAGDETGCAELPLPLRRDRPDHAGRRNTGFGGAAASIDARKQQRIICTAQQYLAGLAHVPPCRFDAVLMDDDGVEWLRNAFEA